MTWTAADTAATIVGALGLVGGVVGFFRSLGAGRKADAAAAEASKAVTQANMARSDAASALDRAASASEQAAKALDRANELTEELLKPPPAPWVIEYGVNRWVLVNKTGHLVPWVTIQSNDGNFAEPAAAWDRVQPDATCMLQAVTGFETATVTVIWMPVGGHEKQFLPITVKRQ